MIPKEIIQDIFTTARIEEVIGEFVQLKRAGSSLKGLSPFIKEKTPSFMVSPAKQIFKDFSSGKGGNVVTFLMEHEAMSYPEALRWLADKYNIEIPEEKATPEEIAQRNEREALFLINKFALEHFEQNLWEEKQGRAVGLSYFKERGFTEDIIKKFNLGYCLEDGSHLTDAAKKAGYNPDHLVTLGLSKKNDKGYYDFFRGRVIFPIHNLTGRVVGFGGRTLRSDKKIAKYFNSPESDIYNKSKVLYGLYQSKSGILRQDNCLLVEGYTDVISLHQNGVDNVVSSSGTALTEGQINLIQRYTQNITILYDGDAAGIKASFRGIDMILEQGMNVRIALFPDGDDPDSFAQKHTTEEINEFVANNAKDFISFKTEVLLKEANNDPIKKASMIKEIVHSISLIPDQITRSVYIRECSDRFEMDEASLNGELHKYIRKQSSSKPNEDTAIQTIEEKAAVAEKIDSIESKGEHHEFELIRLLLRFADNEVEVLVEDDNGEEYEAKYTIAKYIVESLEQDDIKLELPLFADIYEIFLQHYQNDKIPSSSYFAHHPQPEINSISADANSSKYHLSPNWFKMHNIEVKGENEDLIGKVDNAINNYKLKRLRTIKQLRQDSLKGVYDENEYHSIMVEINNYIRVISELSKFMGRVTLK